MAYPEFHGPRAPGDEIWCWCGRNFTRGELVTQQGECNEGKLFWQCLTCNKPNPRGKDDKVVRGPHDAAACLHSTGRKSGITEITWAMPSGNDGKQRTRVTTIEYYPYDRKVPMSHPEPLLFSLWELLQSKVKIILREPNPSGDNALEAADRERARYEARGISEALALLMKPFMETADDVVKHAVKFHKDPTHEPPGLGLHLWDPMLNWDGTYRTPVATPKEKPRAGVKKAAAPKPPSGKKLEPDEIESIKEFIDSGMMDPEEAASMFNVSVETIKAVLV